MIANMEFSNSVFILKIDFRFTHISALDAISFLFHSELESRRWKGSVRVSGVGPRQKR